MALEKSRVLESGFEASYLRIVRAETNYDAKSVDFGVGLYKDAEAREGGYLSAWGTEYTVPLEALGGEPTRANLYDWLKQQEEWAGAKDM